jgi:hypothetical protein
LVRAIKKFEVDVIALQEVGINFNYAGVYGSFKQRIGVNSWLDGLSTRTVNAWNSTDLKRQKQQYGGTAVVTCGDRHSTQQAVGLTLRTWAAGAGAGTKVCTECICVLSHSIDLVFITTQEPDL